MEKLKKLMNSYVPEFAYEPGASDPGSVLTDLCAEMIGTCEERYSRVLSKHRIQYLNLFDPLIQEPVSASRGYVQFQAVRSSLLSEFVLFILFFSLLLLDSFLSVTETVFCPSVGQFSVCFTEKILSV